MDITRKLASVREIAEIIPIAGADKIELARIDGWQCVVQKGKHLIGERVVYFEIDAFLPVKPCYEFLRKACYKNVEGLGEGFRIKTIRLRGELSQGLVMSLEDLEIDPQQIVNDDLTDVLEIKKYEKQIPANLRGKIAGNFPSFIPKTDQERIQNCFNKVDKLVLYEVSTKLDGTSITVYYKDGHIGVCSRNYELQDDGNAYWEAAKSNGWINALQVAGVNMALQGELMGPGIQGNRENLSAPTLFLFDVFDIDKNRYVEPDERQKIALLLTLRHVPIHGKLSIGSRSIDKLLKMADVHSLHHPVAEGLVWKRVDGNGSFKIINNQFLLAEEAA